jgi:hypothetical protein
MQCFRFYCRLLPNLVGIFFDRFFKSMLLFLLLFSGFIRFLGFGRLFLLDLLFFLNL